MIGSSHNLFTISLTVVHTVFALAVTLHVLLHKREVGSAIGWMGLAWLSPVIGSVLYVVFGINRIHRKAYRIRRRRPAWQGRLHQTGAARDDQFAPFAQAVATITQRPLQPGNALRLLRNGDEAYPVMLAAIESATVSIGMASYIFRHDEIGEKFVTALIAAKTRGVDVRVLIDSIGSGYFYSGVLHRLRKQGVKAARFMHSFVPWQMSFLNLRNHRKILVVDGVTAYIGGINIADENVQAGKPSHPVRDVHFEVKGPVVDQIAEAFAVDWWLTTGEELKDKAWFPPLSGCGSAQARVITSGPDLDIEKMDLIFLQAVASARQSIKVATPYFLPDERLITALRLAVMRGVAVDIVVPEESDHTVVDWAMLANAEPLLATGACLWLAPKPFEHSKLLSVDGAWSLIGSANWDVRSMRLNFEITLEVYDADFANLIASQIDRRKGRQMTFAEIATQPLAIRLRDRSARLLLPYL